MFCHNWRRSSLPQKSEILGSEQIEDLLDGNRPGTGHFGKNSVKCPNLERGVKWNGDRMSRLCLVMQPDVASLLANRGVSELFQRPNEPLG